MIYTTYTITASSELAQAAADNINETLMGSGFSSYLENEPGFKSAIESKIQEEFAGCDVYIREHLMIQIDSGDIEEEA